MCLNNDIKQKGSKFFLIKIKINDYFIMKNQNDFFETIKQNKKVLLDYVQSNSRM